MSKATKKVTTLSAARRSAIARKAAQSAWKTMHSTAYQRAAKKGRKAVQSFLDKRAA